jgi:hypothetical protein
MQCNAKHNTVVHSHIGLEGLEEALVASHPVALLTPPPLCQSLHAKNQMPNNRTDSKVQWIPWGIVYSKN